MKNLPLKYTAVLLLVLLSACATYKDQQQTASLTFPDLGTIVKAKGALWYTNTAQIGSPKWVKPIAINVQQLPFNTLSYRNYAQYMANAAKINSIAYVDSLPYKPKYLRLEIADRIAIVEQLNTLENANVRTYLATDADYKLITTWKVTIADAWMPKFLAASKVTLCENDQWGKHLLLTTKHAEERIPFSEIQVFDYEYASFCWGEDRYHRKKIETLLSGNEKCPKGTFKKATKVTSDQSYLKF